MKLRELLGCSAKAVQRDLRVGARKDLRKKKEDREGAELQSRRLKSGAKSR